jgi:serine protease Do
MSRSSSFRTARGSASLPLPLLLLLLVSGPICGRLCAQEAGSPSVAEAIADEVRTLFGKCRKAVVKVEGTDRHGQFFGSGFFIDPNGTLYTSYTIGGEARDIVIVNGNVKLPARRLVADIRSGVALLKVDAETPFLTLGRSTDLRVASPVVTIGCPMGLEASPSFGTVGGFDLRYLTGIFITTHIRANVPVQRGEGGAPLLNMHGEVVGLTIASVDSGSARFVLPIEAAEKIRRDYLRFGEVRPGWLGIGVAPAKQAIAGSTAMIDDLMSDAPASRCGLEIGDILLQIDDRRIQKPEDVVDASFFLTAEDTVKLTVMRGATQRLEFTLEAVEHPSMQHPSEGFASPTLGPSEAYRISPSNSK